MKALGEIISDALRQGRPVSFPSHTNDGYNVASCAGDSILVEPLEARRLFSKLIVCDGLLVIDAMDPPINTGPIVATGVQS